MKSKLLTLFIFVQISVFIYSNPVISAENILFPKNQNKENTIFDLKDKILKLDKVKKHSYISKIENTEMSKTSSMLLGGGIGLVAGGLLGGVLAGNSNDDNPIDEGLSIGGGIIVGGLSGLLVGGLTGYLLGK